MILKKIYTTPKNLFEPVEFVLGINYIFGKKVQPPPGEKVKSLNGIGKSLLLDFINFCLLSDYNKNSLPRLFKIYQDFLKGNSSVLEFEIEKDSYTIMRSFDKPKNILFSKNDLTVSYSLEDFKPVLCNLIFERSNYEGIYNSKWLRRLIPFFIKIQAPKKTPFINPIKYISESTELELNQFHFFFLNLNNTLITLNFEKTIELKHIITSIRKVNKLLSELYGSKLTKDINDKKNKLISEIAKLTTAIKSFKLVDKYRLDEIAADKITAEIKNIWVSNSNDEQRIQSLEESLKVNTSIKVNSVSAIYEELNELLGNNIKKSLNDAIEFRKNLITSRKEFIESEVNRLKKKIFEREKEILELDNKRAEILKILENKKAFSNLQDVYISLSNKQEELKDLTSRHKILEDLNNKKSELKKSLNQISEDISKLISSLKVKENLIAEIISNIYDNLYPGHSPSTIFSLVTNSNIQSKLNIEILENAEMLSHGMNQGRTLIYDLAILFNSIQQKLKMPRFLIHDGIIEGMDKTHFIELVKYLEKQKNEGIKFQYIITLNEEGTLTENFTDGDIVNPAKIEQEAVLVLTPYNKLLNTDF